MLELLAKQPALRTFLVGHTHYNELEVATTGSELVPYKLTGDDGALARFESWEATNPVRSGDGTVPESVIKSKNDLFYALYQHAAQRYARTLEGPAGRELAMIHLTSAADMASQTQNGASIFGFSVLHVTPREDARGYALPQINEITFFRTTCRPSAASRRSPYRAPPAQSRGDANRRRPLRLVSGPLSDVAAERPRQAKSTTTSVSESSVSRGAPSTSGP